MQLLTPRLILRDIRATDAKDIRACAKDLAVAQWLAGIPHPYTLTDARAFITKAKKEAAERVRTNYSLAITIKGKERYIGKVSLKEINFTQGTASMGYYLHTKYHKNGYGFEAASEVIRFAFEYLKLRRIAASSFIENKASIALLEKLGFEFVGIAKEGVVCKATGKIHDEALYGLLAKDWEKAHPIIQK